MKGMSVLKKNTGRFFYGWWIVLGGFFIMATCYTIFVTCMSLFQQHIVADLGISLTQFNTGSSITTLTAIFASLLMGKLVDTKNSRILGSFAVLVCALDLFAFSFVQELWQVYALCFVAGFVVLSGTRLLVSVLITNWFTLKRGLAVSIALAGSGVGGVVLAPMTSGIIETYGWRPAFLVLALIVLIVALPIPAIMFRNRPKDVGLEPYGAHEAEDEHKDATPDTPVKVAVGWKNARKSAAFWILVVGFIMMGVTNGAIIINTISNMTSVTIAGVEYVTGGHDAGFAANVLALYLFVVIFGKLLLGVIYDRFGMSVGSIFGSIATIIAAVALCFPQTIWAPILAAFAFGFGTCLGTVAPPIMAVKQYGKKDIGMITGVITALEMFGAAIGSVVSGLVFDAFHSFVPMWIALIVVTLVMVVALVASVPMARRLVVRLTRQGAPLLDAEGFEIPGSGAVQMGE
jgi:sugar phosphate permease